MVHIPSTAASLHTKPNLPPENSFTVDFLNSLYIIADQRAAERAGEPAEPGDQAAAGQAGEAGRRSLAVRSGFLCV